MKLTKITKMKFGMKKWNRGRRGMLVERFVFFLLSVCPVPMLDDAGTDELPDLVEVFVDEHKSPTSSPLNGTLGTVTGEPGQEVKIRIVFKDKDDKSPIGKITVTTKNTQTVTFIVTTPEDTELRKEEVRCSPE